MAALVSCILGLIKRGELLDRHFAFKHVYDLPFPKTMHARLDAAELNKYEEIFIIGDVHGCYDELIKLLEDANALKDSTLKIFVGDLVNKGHKNQKVLNLLQNSKSMLAVRGNHDEVVLREFFILQKNNFLGVNNNNVWISDLSPENITFLTELPYTITLEPLNAIVVHAGLEPGVRLENNNPYHMVTMRNIVIHDYFWEGGIEPTANISEGDPWAAMWPGPAHVYFGHDAKRMLQRYPFATGLDTGCVYGKQLTGLFINGLRKGTFFSVNAFKTYQAPKLKTA